MPCVGPSHSIKYCTFPDGLVLFAFTVNRSPEAIRFAAPK